MKKKPGVWDNKSYKDMYHFNDNFYPDTTIEDMPSLNVDPKINSTIKENPYRSNVEIEGNEIVLQPDLSALFKAVGKKHSKGGMDVLLKPDSFVFSDDKTLAFGEKDHKMFEFKKGGSFKPEKNTPAEVLKRNIDLKHYNTLVANISDIKKDDLAKRSSTLMLEKYIQTLGNIGFLQEAKKDFPQGPPPFSAGTAPVYEDDVKEDIMEQKQYAKYGGNVLPKAQMGYNPIYVPAPKVKGMNFFDNLYVSDDPNQILPYHVFTDGNNDYYGNNPDYNKPIVNQPTVDTPRTTSKNPYQQPGKVNPQGSLFGPLYTELIKNNPNSFLLSPEAQKAIPQWYPQPQHKRSSGLYGEQDWNLDDFKTRQAWYMKDHPNFDPKNPSDIKAFQEAYNTKAASLKYPNYFVGNKAKGVDGKLGEYTYNAPGFKDTPTTPPNPFVNNEPGNIPHSWEDVPSDTPQKPGEKPVTKPLTPNTPTSALDQGKEINWRFSPWQRVSQLYNLSKLASAKRYMPYRSHLNGSYVDPALVNPEQVIGDMKGAFNQNLSASNSLNPILRNAQAQSTYGQFLNQVPGVRSQYDNQNVGIINQFRQYNNQNLMNVRGQNMQNDQNYYKETVVANQNYDNLKSFLGDQYMNNVMGDVQDNQALAYNLATMRNPAYSYDFRTGNYRRNHKNVMDVESNMKDSYDSLIEQINNTPGMTPAEKVKARIELEKVKKFQATAKKGGRIGRNPYK